MNDTRQRLDAYERWVAYLLVVTFLCLGFLSWWGKKEGTIHSVEAVYQGLEEDQKKPKKRSEKAIKKERQKKRGHLLVKKETV